jgi:phage-related baseplate assembly protein
MLLPGIPKSELKVLKAEFEKEFEAKRAFGRDITISWIEKVLHSNAVHSVNLGTFKAVKVKPFQAAFLKDLTLIFGGWDV